MASTTTLLKNFSATLNPLRGMTKPQIDNMLDASRKGNDARLQVAFELVEQNMPIFGICIQKRLAGIQSRKWDIVPIDDSKTAVAQADQVRKHFKRSDMKNIDGLSEAIRHLAMATFRGRSIVKPFVDEDGLRFKIVNNWNALCKGSKLYFNPAPETVVGCDFESQLEEIPNSEVCWLKESLPIDVPGIQIYLRQLVGEEQWARAVEKYGVAQILLEVPEGTTDASMDQWTYRANRILEGGSGAMPAGTKVTQLDGARGQDPFTSYIDHQMAMISILATGGTLATIGGSSGLGSNVADVQNDQFQSLVSYDCKRIANTLSEVAVAKVCAFLGQEQLCRFEYIEEENTSPSEYIKMAAELKSLGCKIDLQKLKELTKLDFISEEEADLWQPEQEADAQAKTVESGDGNE